MKNYKKIGVVGLGVISNRHIDSIINNSFFNLVSVCDINKKLTDITSKKLSIEGYYYLDDMIKKEDLDIISILTPNGTHLENMLTCIKNKIDFIVEKPPTLKKQDLIDVIKLCKENNVVGYCVLQIRYNSAVVLLKNVLDRGILGTIRGVSLVQRWQRPLEYFSSWRASRDMGGGTLHEIGIHYLDVLQYVFGKPEVISSSCYNTKHKRVDIEDTVYSIFNFNDTFGGNIEITISAEPNNLECSISVLGSNGYIKIGGKSLNVVESYNFLSYKSRLDFEGILSDAKIDNKPNIHGSYEGSSPNHDIIYDMMSKNQLIKLEDTLNVMVLIEEIYNKANYFNCNNPLI